VDWHPSRNTYDRGENRAYDRYTARNRAAQTRLSGAHTPGLLYNVADNVLATRTPALDRTIAVILEAADALRAIRTGIVAADKSAA
jgi:hypothetical protein